MRCPWGEAAKRGKETCQNRQAKQKKKPGLPQKIKVSTRNPTLPNSKRRQTMPERKRQKIEKQGEQQQEQAWQYLVA